ncbi:MAG: signal peptidase II, partial [Phaeodactylibacter sp.]|nr:signal peptidase II [Phaeodactylibacter sp.]
MAATLSPARIVLLFCFILLNFGCDQLSKEVARQQLNYGEQVEGWDEYLVLRLIENEGAFFGLGAQWSGFGRGFVLLFLPAFSLVLLSYFLFFRRPFSWLFALGCTAIIGGAAGNL